jgi:hypothetical protein
MSEHTNETTALILSGQGYELTIAPEAEAKKQELLATAMTVAIVRDNDESACAQRVSRSLAAMRIDVEKCRKIVKEPVNRIGKIIDQTAKDFVAAIEVEEKRITKLVGDHAAEVARIKAEKEREERRAFEEARAAREAAERAAAAAESSGKISDVIAAKQAERERQEALAARMEASAEVAETKVAEGVRFAWDFEVLDIDQLARAHRELVTIEARRADVLEKIKSAAVCFGNDDVLIGAFADVGLRVFKKPVVSSR